MKKLNGKICAYSPVVGDKYIEIGIAVFKERGYHPLGYSFPTWDDAQDWCNEKNRTILGLNEEQAHLIIISSMFPESTVTVEDVIEAGDPLYPGVKELLIEEAKNGKLEV